MYQFSTDRLAGLDTMILKITTPPKVPTLIPNRSPHHDTNGIPTRKLKKQDTHCETRTPLADKTASNNVASRPPHSTSSMLLHTRSTVGKADILPPEDDVSSRVPYSPDVPSFRPLPPLPSASTLQLPSFLNLSTRSFTSNTDAHPCRPTTSLPASVLLRVCSPVTSSRPIVVHNEVSEGPQWVLAFHHPNSPYVPWSSPVRRRILPPPSPFPPSLDCSSSPFVRSGAVAPEPWTSSTFSLARNRSRKERIINSWKSLKSSIRKGVKTVVYRLGKPRTRLRTLCISQDMLSTYDDTTAVQPNLISNAMRITPIQAPSAAPTPGQSREMQTAFTEPHSRDSRVSIASSDSMTLAAWLAERRASASRVIDNTPREMSVEEYELMGSWLDLRHCDGGWVCGVRDCGMHSADGSPYAESGRLGGLRMAMPFDSADLLSVTRPSPSLPFPAGPFSAWPRYHSYPRLHCQSFDIHFVQPATLDLGRNCMPGGWTLG